MTLAPIDALIIGMVFVTVLLVLVALQGRRLSPERPLEERLSHLGLREGPPTKDTATDELQSREAVRRALKELEALQKGTGRSYLRHLLKTSGVDRKLSVHIVISVVLGLVIFALAFVLGLGLVSSLVLAIALGAWLPIWQLKRAVNKRMKLFVDDMPGALDLVVRGIRAGLPLLECLKLTANEWRDPLRSEFLQVINDMGIGLTIKEAIARFAERVPLQEAKLFAIVIAIQAQSGGNLSEVLSNLSELLRERSKLQAKVKAMTSEARTSAWIIGGIPVLLIAAVSLFSPGFLVPLFETGMGNVILVGCVVWMGLGMVVMASMMKVDL